MGAAANKPKHQGTLIRPDQRNRSRPLIFLTPIVEKLTELSSVLEKSTKNQVPSRLKAAFFALICRLCIAVGSEKTAAKARPTVIFVSDKDRLLWVFGIWHGVCFSPMRALQI